MDFSLNEDQEMFRGYVRKYLVDAGQTRVARDYIKGKTDSLREIQAGLAELGCTAINISEKYGGLGLTSLDLVPVLEEMGRAILPGVYLETMGLAVPLLEKYGTEELKEKYLPEIASGRRSITLAWLEPSKNYALGEVECNAADIGDSYVINGVKGLVPDGDQADTFLLLIRTNERVTKEDGLSFILVDQTPDLEIKIQKSIDGTRHLCQINFDNVKVSKQQVLGSVDKGWEILHEGLLYLNGAITSYIVGGMDKVVEMATEYAKIREQFGQPIGRFQAIKHRIVDMKTELESARSLSYYANWGLEGQDQDREAAIYSARAYATDAYIRIAGHNIQIHGGIGVTEELDCQLFLKRARYFENYLGSISYYNEQTALALGW
ncbi:acyl-CoA dehydrogenase family protein [Neobacillus vireti]|uniref:acyl-CoA dehydrogenase family protein n=1 Tax=Neobacillus vireti TaxID=220686 RepID=UPI002FFDBC88